MTVIELLSGARTIDQIVAQLGGEEDVAQRVTHPDDALYRKLEELTAGLEPNQRRVMEVFLKDTAQNIEKTIREGDFPVYLPLASILPLLVELNGLSPQKYTPEELEAALLAAVAGLEEEDLRLYGRLLRRWLDENHSDEPETAPAVHMVAALVATGTLEPFDWPLMIAGVELGVNGYIPGEEALMRGIEEDILKPASLESYAEFLGGQGYPALAARTRRLATVARQQAHIVLRP